MSYTTYATFPTQTSELFGQAILGAVSFGSGRTASGREDGGSAAVGGVGGHAVVVAAGSSFNLDA